MVRRLLFRASLVLLAAVPASALFAQAIEPTNNFRVSVNGVFALCPLLVRGEPAPDAAGLAKLGLSTIASPTPGDSRYEGLSGTDNVQVRYESAEHRCTVNYSGAGYASVAGVARALVLKNGLVLLTGGDKGGARGDVYEGPAPNRPVRARFIVIENATSHTAAISYTEKAR